MESRKTLLITGANGFVGKAAVEKALAEGWHVIAVVRGKEGERAVVPPELAAIANKYRGRGCMEVERADLTDEKQVQALFCKHKVDQVLHTAACVKVTDTPEGIAEAYRINVLATQHLAQAAEQAAVKQKQVIQFHYVSSVSALMYEKDAVLPGRGVSNQDYAAQKAKGAAYFKMHEAELPHLDVAITYPYHLLGNTPSKAIGSTVLRLSLEEKDGQPVCMHPYYAQFQLDKNAANPLQVTHLDNYLGAVFHTFHAAPTPQVREYSIKADYEMTLGELIRLCDQVISRGRARTYVPWKGWSEPGEQYVMDFKPRDMERVPGFVERDIDLRDTLWNQYQALKAEKTLQRCG